MIEPGVIAADVTLPVTGLQPLLVLLVMATLGLGGAALVRLVRSRTARVAAEPPAVPVPAVARVPGQRPARSRVTAASRSRYSVSRPRGTAT